MIMRVADQTTSLQYMVQTLLFATARPRFRLNVLAITFVSPSSLSLLRFSSLEKTYAVKLLP